MKYITLLIYFFVCFLAIPIAGFAEDADPAEPTAELAADSTDEPTPDSTDELDADPAEPTADPAVDPALDELRDKVTEKAPLELMNFSLGDANVSLFLTGSWKGTLQANLGFSNSALGRSLISPETPLLFTQEADLTLALWINDRWFVEANFLDDSKMNTYRAGYQGLPGEYIQYAGVGNTGLDFPEFPYLDLGGDSPSSFGFYSRLGNGDLEVHTLFRYDSAVREERVFVGGRERTYSYVGPQNPVRGISFVLPDTSIDTEPLVYIEDARGDLRDSRGRRWRLAFPSEYAAGKTNGLLELNIRPGGMVAVAYSKGGNNRPWNTSMGNYDGAPSGFLAEVQRWFDPARKINLANYPQCGNGRGPSARPGEVVIGGNYALVIRQPGAFSPFERQNRYEAPSGDSEQAALVSISSGKMVSGFELVRLDTSAATADISLYTAEVSQLGMYELLPEGVYGRRDPASRWPLAEMYPEIYLSGSGGFSGDLGLRFTNFDNTGEYIIGTDVVPGSVQVWRSGIQFYNFQYDEAGGSVALFGPVGTNEVIRITYLKQTDETRLGSIAAGLGAIYRRGNSPFSASAALGIRWNLTENSSFTEEEQISPGSVGLSAKTAWDYDYLKAQITAGLAFEQMDTTGLYRAAGMEGNEIVLSMPPESSFISHPPESASLPLLFSGLYNSNRADLIYRNYRDNSTLSSTLMTIDWGGASVISGYNRPYPARDPQLGSETQVLVAEFKLNDTYKWTGFQVPLGFDSDFLSRCVEIEIPFRLYGFKQNSFANFKLFVQIGSLSGKDFSFNESTELIWEKLLYDGASPAPNSQIARFVLTDEDRLKLGDAKYLRVIAVYGGGGVGEDIEGRVLLAPPIVRGAAFRAVTADGTTVKGAAEFSLSGTNRVTTAEIVDNAANPLESVYSDIINRLHPTAGTQRVLKIEWEKMEQGISAGADSRLGAIPLADYRSLSFFVKGPSAKFAGQAFDRGTLDFFVAPGPDSISRPYLEAHIPLSAFKEGKWSKVTIRYRGNDTGIDVDGGDSSGSWFRYRPMNRSAENVKGGSGYAAVLIKPENNDTALEDGSICIDEIILEDAAVVYRLNAGASVEYTRPGALVKIGDMPLLADFLFSTAVESEFHGDPQEQNTQITGSMMNRSSAEISVLDTKITGNLAFTAAEDTFLWNASHGISRSWGPFSVEESFHASPAENSSGHQLNIDLDSAFYFKFEAASAYDFSRLERKWNLETGYQPANIVIPSLGIITRASWTSKDGQIEEDEKYGELWLRTWEPMVPDIGAGAETRRTSTQITLTEASKPIGAVITLDGNTNFTGANNTTRLENTAGLDVPVSFGSTSLIFTAKRGFKRHLDYSGADALEDGNKFFESIADSLPLWGVAPGYSLFAPELNDAMDQSLINSPSSDLAFYTAFNDQFGVTAVLPQMYSPAAFVIPANAGFRLERVLEQKMDTRADILNLTADVGFSAINMFGRMGYLPLFNFYRSDEYTHSIETTVIIPRDEEISWRVRSAVGAGFHGFSGGVLNLANTLTIRSNGNWVDSVRADWTVPTQKSPLSVFYRWASNKAISKSSWPVLTTLLRSNFEQLRTESLEITLEKSPDDFYRWRLSLGHESIIRILGRLNFSVFVKLNAREDIYNEIFMLDASVGTTLRLTF